MGLTKPRAYQIYDLDYKQSVRVVTVVDITLSGGAPSSVDGVSLSLNDRILVTGQSTVSQNGIYYVTTVGSGSNGTWARSADTNQTGELDSGTIVMVTEGLIYADTQWKLITDDPIVIGSSELIFVQNYSANSISSGNSNVTVQANSNVSIAVSGSNIVVFSNGTENITANIVPTANVTYDLGSATNRFKDLYLANNSIFLGNVTLSATETDLTVNGATVITASGSSTLSLTGNITGGNLISNALITGITVVATGNVSGGNLNSDAQVVATGNITGGNLITVGQITATGNITGGNINSDGNVRATDKVYGLELWSTQSDGDEGGQLNLAQAVSNSTLSGDSVTVDIWQNRFRIFEQGGNARGAFIDISACTPGVGTNLLAGGGGGTPGGANTQIQFNDEEVFGGNAAFTFNKSTNQVTATGNIQANYFLGDGSALTGIVAGLTWTTQANTAPSSPKPGDFWYDSFADIKYQYTNDGTSNVWIDQSYPTSFSTLTVQNIVNGGANGTGNIGTAGGSFNTAFVKATSAQYADLAEIYEADQDYPPGTVVVFGGNKEVTVTDQSHDTRVAGVISTDPAFIMNSHAAGLPVAFTGRVPCRVQGPVTKGDVLVTSSIPGVAQKLGYNFQPGCVLGKSLQNISDNTVQIIEVVVGRF